MTRDIVLIDEEKCDGCGLCVPSCKEGALQIVGGKAKLVGDALCDGLGACLGECPQGAIRVEKRETVAYDHKAVERHLATIRSLAPHLSAFYVAAAAAQLPLARVLGEAPASNFDAVERVLASAAR